MTQKTWQEYDADDLNKTSEAMRKLVKSLSLVDVIMKLAKFDALEPQEVENLLEMFYDNNPKEQLETIASELDKLATRLRHKK